VWDVGVLPDEGGVFKSKRTTRYTADEIQDSSETKTDLPLDQRRAEEVEVRSADDNDDDDDMIIIICCVTVKQS